MVTVLTDGETIEVPAGRVEGDRLWLSEAELENATGWSARKEGLCRGDVCVPIPPGRERDFLQRLGARGGGHRARVGAAVARGTELHLLVPLTLDFFGRAGEAMDG